MIRYQPGHRWGMLTLVRLLENPKLLLQCDCGQLITYTFTQLKHGKRSCGCTDMGQSIYFIRVNEYVKIGRTRTIMARWATVQTNCPYEAELIRVIPDTSSGTEKWLHEYFQYLHKQGEWFKYTEEMLTIIPPI